MEAEQSRSRASSEAETKEEELTIEEDKGKLRQDRYALRTAPQFIGPQLEDMMSALKTLEIECNSSELFYRSLRTPDVVI